VRETKGTDRRERVGFIGLGLMGQPMALNLALAGTQLVVWNRSPARCEPLRAVGAVVAPAPAEVFRSASTVILMLAGEAATDLVLGRGRHAFGANVEGRTVVQMATTSPGHSRRLAAEIEAAGGAYVEAPVSGSRAPAETGELVCLLAGRPGAVAEVEPLLAPMCRRTILCGETPKALLMKLALNLYLDTIVVCLAEAAHFAERNGLDLRELLRVLELTPMASATSDAKLAKLVARDFSVHASAANVLENTRLIAEAAREAGAASPLLDLCRRLYRETVELGHGGLDMAAVVHAIEARAGQAAALSRAC
jgi:3-hydroxyisobutyrate dehydrogenase